MNIRTAPPQSTKGITQTNVHKGMILAQSRRLFPGCSKAWCHICGYLQSLKSRWDHERCMPKQPNPVNGLDWCLHACLSFPGSLWYLSSVLFPSKEEQPITAENIAQQQGGMRKSKQASKQKKGQPIMNIMTKELSCYPKRNCKFGVFPTGRKKINENRKMLHDVTKHNINSSGIKCTFQRCQYSPLSHSLPYLWMG